MGWTIPAIEQRVTISEAEWWNLPANNLEQDLIRQECDGWNQEPEQLQLYEHLSLAAGGMTTGNQLEHLCMPNRCQQILHAPSY